MTSDKNYLGEGNVNKFDALFFKLRQFVPDDQGENCIAHLYTAVAVGWKPR